MDDLPSTRRTLLARLKDLSADGPWDEFCGVYQAAIYRFVRKHGLSTADADDVVQEVLASVFASIGDWKPDGREAGFRRWLARITRHAAIDCLRANKRRSRLFVTGKAEHPFSDIAEQRYGLEEQFEAELQMQTFRWAAERVKGQVAYRTWRSFWITAVEGRPARDAVSETGASLGSVYAAKCRVMARIRDEVRSLNDREEATVEHA